MEELMAEIAYRRQRLNELTSDELEELEFERRALDTAEHKLWALLDCPAICACGGRAGEDGLCWQCGYSVGGVEEKI